MALLGLMAIFLVYEHSRVTRAGIEISRLSRDEARLVEELRILNVRVTRLCQPEFIQGQVERLVTVRQQFKGGNGGLDVLTEV